MGKCCQGKPTKYEDADKCASDIFKRGYDLDGQRATMKATSKDGVTFTKEIKQTSKGVVGKLAAKYKDASGFHVEKVEVKSDHTFTSNLSLNGAAKGAKFTLDVVLKDILQNGKDEKSEVGLEYQMGPSMSILKVDPVNGTLNANFLSSYKKFAFGASVNTLFGNTSKPFPIKAYGGLVGYHGPGYNMNFRYTKTSSKNTGVFSMFHKYSDKVTFASLCTYDFTRPKEAAVSTKMGGKYVLDKNVVFQGMLDEKADLSLSCSHLVRPALKVTASATVNMEFMQNTSSPTETKFGLGFDLGDF